MEKQLDTNQKEQTELLFETRSEDVQEIIGKMPSWIIRWGITWIGIIVLGMFILASIIKTPVVVNCAVQLTSDAQLEVISSVNSGIIEKFLINNGDKVKKNTPILLLESGANYEEILVARKNVEKIYNYINNKGDLSESEFLSNLRLGAMQLAYAELLKDVSIYKAGNLNKNKILNKIKVFFEQYQHWEHSYLIKSKEEGYVSFVKKLAPHSKIGNKEELVVISKGKDSETRVRASVSVNQIKSVVLGQEVKIKLNDYSTNDFGYIKGKIASISDIPIDNNYILYIDLENKGLTSKGMKLPAFSMAEGTGEIIIKNISALQKVFENTLKI